MKKLLITLMATIMVWCAVYYAKVLPFTGFTLLANVILASGIALVVMVLCLAFVPKEEE